MQAGKRHIIKMKSPPPDKWSGHRFFHVLEFSDKVQNYEREYIGLATTGESYPPSMVAYIPKASILEVAMLLFEIAEREGLTEIKEETS